MARFVPPTEPKHVHLQGLWHRVRFLAVIPHGRGTREVAVDVPPELIFKLAEALRATQGTACDTEYSRHCDDTEDGLHITHAIWHVQHPDAPMPCVDHSKVIDMGALPAPAGDTFCDCDAERDARHDDECAVRSTPEPR